MKVGDLIKKQIDFDTSHGFRLNFTNERERYEQISKDLIGLFGEIGEFANIVKKIQIQLDRSTNANSVSIDLHESNLREELIDSLIYLIRLAKLTGTDIETEYIKKLSVNLEKYKDFHE